MLTVVFGTTFLVTWTNGILVRSKSLCALSYLRPPLMDIQFRSVLLSVSKVLPDHRHLEQAPVPLELLI